ncbi:MAG: hypothetical protein IJT54_04435 [Candidatus Methanomethylophilaceae archaeon]|nr:hypothetical protein [Candidatus Methanomethylophilaceae archaeon]
MMYTADTKLSDLSKEDKDALMKIVKEHYGDEKIAKSVFDGGHTLKDLEDKMFIQGINEFLDEHVEYSRLASMAKKAKLRKMRGGKKKIRDQEQEKRMRAKMAKRQLEAAEATNKIKTDHEFKNNYKNPKYKPVWKKDTTYRRKDINSEWEPIRESGEVISENVWHTITSPKYLEDIEKNNYVDLVRDNKGRPVMRKMLYGDQLTMVVTEVRWEDSPDLKSFNKKR